MLAGALVSGAGNYVFQMAATRLLGDEAFAPLGVIWTIWYLLLTVLIFSIEAWVTRWRARAGTGLRRVVPQLTGVLGVTSVAIGAVSWVAREALFDGLASLAGVAALLTVTYGVFAVARGDLAGRTDFRSYGLLTGVEALAKLVLLVPVALLAPTTTALAWIMPTGPLVALAWYARIRRRPRPRATATAGTPAAEAPDDDSAEAAVDAPATPEAPLGLGRFVAALLPPSASAQALLAAGPLVLVGLGASAAEISVYFVTITAARVPIVLAFGGVLTRALEPMTRLAHTGRQRELRRLAVLIAVCSVLVGLLGALVGGWAGPPLVGLLFGSPFAPPSWLAAYTGYGVLVATGGMLLNQVLVAQGRERALTAPWVLGLLVAVALIAATGGEAMWRVSVGFVGGETAAVAALAVAALRGQPPQTGSDGQATEHGPR